MIDNSEEHGRGWTMPPTIADAKQTRLSQLASFLERDISSRGLRPGEPYLTAAGASELLGVSRMTANRALNLLARRRLLVRHRSRGTFVGPEIVPATTPDTKCVHYITFVDDNPAHQLPVGRMLSGFQSAIEGISLKTHILPLNMTPQKFRAEMETLSYGSKMTGMVITLGTREIQQAVVESGIPAVVHGSVYPGIDLPSLEVDQEETGRLMAEQAIRLGFRRLVFVAREYWRRGDNLALDGIQQAAAAAGLGNASVMVRNVSTEAMALRVGVEEILADVPRGAAFICRLPYFAAAIVDVAKGQGLRVPQDYGIVYDHTAEEGRPPLPYPCVRSQFSVQEQMAVMGRMLDSIAKGARPDPYRAVVPARFDED
jgi:DNA-binding LacI/PurR family transcriptional regulator